MTTPASDTTDTTGPVRIRINDVEYEVSRPTESQLLGLIMLVDSGLPELQQTQHMIKLLTSVMPPEAHSAFIGEFIRGNYGLNDLIATFGAVTGIDMDKYMPDAPQAVKAAPTQRKRKSASGNPAKRTARKPA